MPSSPQLSLMTKILNLKGVYALNYSITDNVGIFISVEEENKEAICQNCQRTTQKIHKNIDATLQDIQMGNQDVFLKN